MSYRPLGWKNPVARDYEKDTSVGQIFEDGAEMLIELSPSVEVLEGRWSREMIKGLIDKKSGLLIFVEEVKDDSKVE